MAQTVLLAGYTEDTGSLVRALMGHAAGDGITKAVLISDYGLEDGDGTYYLLAGEDVGEANAVSIIDADIKVFPTDTSDIGLARIE